MDSSEDLLVSNQPKPSIKPIKYLYKSGNLSSSSSSLTTTTIRQEPHHKRQIFHKFEFEFEHRNNHNKELLKLKRLHNQKHLSKASLNLSSISLPYLKHTLQLLPNIKNLNLNLLELDQRTFKKINSRFFKKLFKHKISSLSLSSSDILLPFKNLKLRSLHIQNNIELDRLLQKNQKNLIGLHTLTILGAYFQRSEDSFTIFSNSLNKFVNLRTLYAFLGTGRKSLEDLSCLCLPYLLEKIKTHPYLKNLNLFIKTNEFDQVIANQFAFQSLSQSLQGSFCRNLEELTLDLDSYRALKNEHFKLFIPSISQLENIKKLSLVFSPIASLSEGLVIQLSKAISTLKALKSIKLKLPVTHITDDQVLEFLQNLHHNIDISSSQIDLNGYFEYERNGQKSILFKGRGQLSQSTMIKISQKLVVQNLFKAKRVDLSFITASDDTQKALPNLTRELILLEEPNEIYLDLAHSGSIGRNPIQINEAKTVFLGGSYSKRAAFLQGLSLHISEAGLDIQKLELDFSKASSLQGDVLLSIAELFTTLKHVKERRIIFAKIEPEANSKFKVTSALAQIFQCGGEIVLRDQGQDLSENDIAKNNLFNNLIRPERLHDIREIELKFKPNDIMTYLTFDILKRNTSKIEQLEKLNLDFAKCPDFGAPEDFKTLQLFTKEFKNLTYLSLNFGECIISEGIAELISFISEIKDLNHLKQLSLNFEECKMVIDDIVKALAESLLFLVDLNQIFLNFKGYLKLPPSCSQLTDQGFVSLAQGLNASKNLKTFHVILNECQQVTDKGITAIASSLIEIPGLQSVNLNCRKCTAVTDSGISSLTQTFGFLKNINKIILNFEECSKITNDELTKMLKGTSPSLQHLDLNFAWNKNITDDGLSDICKQLSRFPELKFLSLNFHWCYKVSDNGIEEIAKGLKNLPLLDGFEINFTGCLMISDRALASIGNALLAYSKGNLKHLQLTFSECTKITNQGLVLLAQSLYTLKTIKYLSLDFKKCPSISDQAMMRLVPAIYSIRNIEELKLDFNWCSKISHEIVNHFIAELGVLANLNKANISFQGFQIEEESPQEIKKHILKKKEEVSRHRS